MAGRFLTAEEAALQLGVDVDEINRLVDRKKLFPMRDGGMMKFKYDDIVRYSESRGESSDVGDPLSLDLDGPSPAGEPVSILEMDLGSDAIGDAIDAGASIFDDAGGPPGVSETILRGGQPAGDDLAIGSGLSLGGGSALSGIAIGDGSSPGSLAIGSDVAAGSGPATGLATGGSGSGGTAALSNLAGVTGIGDRAGLSVAGESGLSLEDDDVQLSGIQLSGVDLSGAGFSLAEGSGVDLGAVGEEDAAPEGGTMLAGESFELGVSGGDEESASVVIATDSESGDSSFFGATIAGGESSVSGDSSSMQMGESSMHFPAEMLVGTSFSALQICGLVCCSLLLLIGGFICFDLVSSIGSVRGVGFTTPILEGLTTTLGLR